MNYLIQAYACSPDKGGEFAVSWGWITHLDSKISEDDNVYVLSLTLKENDIDRYHLKNVHLIPINGLEKYNFLHFNNIYHYIWLNKAYKATKNTGINFDYIHAYSLSDYRKPGKWYKFKDAITVFGPVGGAQNCPKSLTSYDSKSGKIRSLINNAYAINPFFKSKIKKYRKVYACNYETQKVLPNSKLLPDVPLRDDFRNLNIDDNFQDVKIPVILFCGRLINKKGILLLLDVLKRIPDSIDYRCEIFGDGNQKEQILSRIQKLNLTNKVSLNGYVDFNDMSRVYEGGNIFVLPSLRESGGSVLIEAMAHKLPIVALNMSLSKVLAENDVGLFVNINQDTEGILNEFAEKIIKLISDPSLRKRLGNNGYRYANNELNWDVMINRIYGKN